MKHKSMLDEAVSYYLEKYPDADFFISESQLTIMDVRTCMDKPLFKNTGKHSEGYFLFIDLKPEANWAHDCIYVFIHVSTTGYHHETHIEQADAQMPPQEKWYEKLKSLRYCENSQKAIREGLKKPI